MPTGSLGGESGKVPQRQY